MLNIYRNLNGDNYPIPFMLSKFQKELALEVSAMISTCKHKEEIYNVLVLMLGNSDEYIRALNPIKAIPFLEEAFDVGFTYVDRGIFFNFILARDELNTKDLLDLIEYSNEVGCTETSLLELNPITFDWEGVREAFLKKFKKFYYYARLDKYCPERRDLFNSILRKEWYHWYSVGNYTIDRALSSALSPKEGDNLLDYIIYLRGSVTDEDLSSIIYFWERFKMDSIRVLSHLEKEDRIPVIVKCNNRILCTEGLENVIKNYSKFPRDTFSSLMVQWGTLPPEMRTGDIDTLIAIAIELERNPTKAEACFLASRTRKATFPTDIEFKNSHYTGRFLSPSDPTGLKLGVLTNCCQHFGGEGESCAVHGQTSPYGGFFAIYDGKKVIAQSWAWVGYLDANKGGVCFDNIECLGGLCKRRDTILDIYKQAAESLLGKVINGITVTLVTVGTGHDDAGVRVLPASKPIGFLDYNGYYDSSRQRLLAKIGSDAEFAYLDDMLDADAAEDDEDEEDFDPFADDNDFEERDYTEEDALADMEANA